MGDDAFWAGALVGVCLTVITFTLTAVGTGYLLRSRRPAARPSRQGRSSLSGTESPEYARFWNAVAGTLNSYCIRHGHQRPLFSERNQFVLAAWRALHPHSSLPANAITPAAGPPRPRRKPPAGGAGEAPARRAPRRQRGIEAMSFPQPQTVQEVCRNAGIPLPDPDNAAAHDFD